MTYGGESAESRRGLPKQRTLHFQYQNPTITQLSISMHPSSQVCAAQPIQIWKLCKIQENQACVTLSPLSRRSNITAILRTPQCVYSTSLSLRLQLEADSTSNQRRTLAAKAICSSRCNCLNPSYWNLIFTLASFLHFEESKGMRGNAACLQ